MITLQNNTFTITLIGTNNPTLTVQSAAKQSMTLVASGQRGPQGERGLQGPPGPVGNLENLDLPDFTLIFENQLV